MCDRRCASRHPGLSPRCRRQSRQRHRRRGAYGPRGFDVVAYDSRAHGESDGDVCTYGFYEARDLHRVLDTVAPGPVVLFGTSLGAAVALQETAGDPRVTAVVAAETFSDLRTVASERAPVGVYIWCHSSARSNSPNSKVAFRLMR